MALPSSGQLTLAQIRDEFGAGTTSNVSLRTLSAAAGLSAPDGFNEFYGLSAFAVPTLQSTGGTGDTVTGSGTAANPYVCTQTFTGSFRNEASFLYDCPDIDPDGTYVQECFNADPDSRFFYHNPVTFRVQEQTAMRAKIKITSASINGFQGYYPIPSSMYVKFEGFFTGGVDMYYGTSTTSALQTALNQVNTWNTHANGIGVGVDLRVMVLTFKPAYNYCGEPSNYNFTHPQINNITYQIWFEKV